MTDYTKYNYYKPDGAGRDLYIIYNNGGELRGGVKPLTDKVLFPKITKGRVFHSLKRDIPPVTYRSDGSGRDSYILYYCILTKKEQWRNEEGNSLNEHF